MPIRYSSDELIKILKRDGWYFVGANGSHHKYKHPVKKGHVEVPHPKKIVAQGTAVKILKKSGCYIKH